MPTTLLVHPRGATIAMGMFAMADRLHREGLPVRIIHHQMERRLNRRFELSRLIRLHDVKIVGVSVHWMHQSFEALKLTEGLKLSDPEVLTVWGGFTASAFAGEIVRDFQVVDAVVRGDGEEPLLALARAVAAGKAGADVFRDAPNVVWRDADRLVQNPVTYVADGESMSGLCFTRFELMQNADVYLNTCSMLSGTFPAPTYFLSVGRGCPVNCPWCGGARTAFALNTGRKKIAYRSVDSAVSDWRRAMEAGCRSVYVCFEPVPNGPYYFELFERLKAEGLNTVPLAFGCWAMPSPEFIEALRATFPRALVELSPETSSEPRRRIVRGWPYTNEVLEDRIARCLDAGIDTDLYFSYPHPGETTADIWETSEYASALSRRFPRANVAMLALSTDPNAPLFQNPEAFGMSLSARSFAEYVAGLARLERDQRPWLENELFHRPDAVSERELLRTGFGVHLCQALRRRAQGAYFGVVEVLGGEAEAERWLDRQIVEPLWQELARRREDEGQLVLDQTSLYAMFVDRLAHDPPTSAERPGISAVVGDALRLHNAYLRVLVRGKSPDLHGRGSQVEHSYLPVAAQAIRTDVNRSRWRPVVNPSAERVELRYPLGASDAPLDLAALAADPPAEHATLIYKDFAERIRTLSLGDLEHTLIRSCDGVTTLAELAQRLGPGALAAAGDLADKGALL
jgi:radical SAM superfamily enzyme YgiQ (UPF0313 family)